jgi:hypothetical protein
MENGTPSLQSVTASSSGPPANITEFNRIAGLVFAQLYAQFPAVIDIDRQAIANAFGVQGSDWSAHQLPSGKKLSEMLAHTIGWLNHQGYIASFGAHPAAWVMLSVKELAALNATPQGLSATVGSSLVKAASEAGPNWSGIGDLVGGVFGGFTKSITGGEDEGGGPKPPHFLPAFICSAIRFPS